MGRRKNKPRLIPEQDKRICGSICFCQLTMVLSCVSIVYLSVAVYSPSFQAFKSGFEPDPVMCQTVDIQMPNNCPWASCGEWCLTKTSGFCPQIHSVVRRNGTDIQLNNCTRITTTSCPMIDLQNLKKFNCNNGTACNNLRGVFNCSNGHCKNMSEFFLCHHKADGPTLNSEKDNTKLNGFFECRGIQCTKIKKPFLCDRYCSKITTTKINVLLMQDNNLVTAECEHGVAFNEARGPNKGVRIPPTDFWKEDDGDLLANCMTVAKDGDKIVATDCLNGTLLDHDIFPHPFMNFTQFWEIYDKSNNILDPDQRFLPKQDNLTIYSSKKLFINLEGCVNTLRGECKDFVARYGSDGDNDTAQSRYQCFYNKAESVPFVVARFDLDKTYKELLIALILPIVLFVLSSISLCIITNTVKVGDDAKMRCVCSADDSDGDGAMSMGLRNQNGRYQDEDCPMGLADLPEDQPTDSHEMIGSTKSLIPISPCEETADNAFHDEKSSKCDAPEKPLVVI
ncbi:uncharacterized protein LOC129945905 [Eupeodes corollae]|uniref:uncharacterized protein LOC129945905 n=1 Tax=Eupeodes corollae TaxID=290404 RepID=UPI00248FC942|nr:uncharacterized protein LOC129945905 [Eupeodes corollae]XP_055911843.1 uncharacterized protein LOC129945905 [Eupeodes corollae]